MDKGFLRKVLVGVYVIVILFIELLGFAYSNQENSKYHENFIEYDSGWTIDNVEIKFPYEDDTEFVISNTMPNVYGDQFLIFECYYDDYSIEIDGNQVYRSVNNKLFNSYTNVGKKEIHLPLKEEYSGKKIDITLKLQKSLYGSEVYGAYISTRSGYGIYVLKKQWLQLVVAVILFFYGFCEVLIAAYFIAKRSHILRKLSFEALLYAGIFAITASVWLICQTRLLYIVFGNGTGFAILEIIVFLMMPLAFFELVRAVNFRVSFVDNVVDGIIAVLLAGLFILCLFGVIDWGQLVVIGHLIALVILGITAYYSYTSLKEAKRKSERRLIAIGNLAFLLVCLVSLAMYINDIDSNYNIFLVIGLMIYIATQVGLIYKRIGLKVEEEEELVQAKEFAYTDELTHLTNRRYFYEELALLNDRELLKDTTVVYLDVNRLKYYNDNFGHDAGDELLKACAYCLNSAFDDSPTAVISRIGGDEFVVMLIASESEIKRRIDKFNHLASTWKGKYIDGFSAAIGVAAIRDYPDSMPEELCNIADDNMLIDKKNFYSQSVYERRKN
ncbi:sensor domain-containing diguanylate cyclase [Pseudobutyrivibrio ruminis]|uniref:GGDEF domain-containing protein n=1 Tax=Pseudobutyrivibrio ruminis TaxID=46206 RepID=UPI000427B3C1|nr:GGDEF domain-containing protein [Pseudobutyrivibrio ruminis]